MNRARELLCNKGRRMSINYKSCNIEQRLCTERSRLDINDANTLRCGCLGVENRFDSIYAIFSARFVPLRRWERQTRTTKTLESLCVATKIKLLQNLIFLLLLFFLCMCTIVRNVKRSVKCLEIKKLVL